MSELSQYEAARLYEEALQRRGEGNVTGAFARYWKVLQDARTRGDARLTAQLTGEIAELYQEMADLLEARRWYGEALELYRGLDDQPRVAQFLLGLAQVEQLSGDAGTAERRFRDAVDAYRELRDAQGEARSRAGLGQLLWEMGRETDGAAELIRAWTDLRQANDGDADAVREQIRQWSVRLGRVRYRRMIEAACEDAAIRELLAP